jgi:hypothetical protein
MKNPKVKRIGNMAQVIECLPSKNKALSSTPQYHQKKEKRKIKP